MMSIVALMFGFAFTENLVVSWGAGLRSFVGPGKSRSFRKDAMTGLYLVLAAFVSASMGSLLSLWPALSVLMIPIWAFSAVYLPLVLRRVLQGWILEADDWESERHYSWSAALILMYSVDLYRLNPLSGLLAGLAAASANWLIITLWSLTMDKLSYEQLPRFLRPLPLSFLILGIMGIALAGFDAVLAETKLFTMVGG